MSKGIKFSHKGKMDSDILAEFNDEKYRKKFKEDANLKMMFAIKKGEVSNKFLPFNEYKLLDEMVERYSPPFTRAHLENLTPFYKAVYSHFDAKLNGDVIDRQICKNIALICYDLPSVPYEKELPIWRVWQKVLFMVWAIVSIGLTVWWIVGGFFF